MPRRKKLPGAGPSNGSDLDIQVGDLTKTIYPEGVPTNGDGTVASTATISSELMREIGAATPEAAQRNRQIAKKIQKKLDGGTDVRWGEEDPLDLYDTVRKAFGVTNTVCVVKRIEPTLATFAPFNIGLTKNSVEFYNYILKHVHKNAPASKYEIKFKQNGGEHHGTAHLYIDTDDASKGHDMPIPPPYGYPPGYPGYPPGYPPPTPPMGYGGYPPGYPAPQYAQPPPQYEQPAPVRTAPPPPPPEPAPVPQFTSPPAPVGQSQPTATEQYLMNAIASLYQKQERADAFNSQLLLQNERMIGMFDEYRNRSSGQLGAPPQQAPTPTPGYPQGGTGAYPPQQPQYPGYPPGYGPPGVQSYAPMQQQQQPVQHVQAVPVAAANPMDAVTNAIGMVSAMTRAVDSMRAAMNPAPLEGDDPEPIAAAPLAAAATAITPPFTVTPLGIGPNAPAAAINKDGSIHWPGTLMGLLPTLLDSGKNIMQSLTEQQKQQIEMNEQMHMYSQQMRQPPVQQLAPIPPLQMTQQQYEAQMRIAAQANAERQAAAQRAATPPAPAAPPPRSVSLMPPMSAFQSLQAHP